MTRVRIAPPDTEEDVSAEQVAAYLLRPGSGWVERPRPESPWRSFAGHSTTAEVPTYTREGAGTWLALAIHDIARAEGRHPSAVLANIVGPTRGVGGVECAERKPGPRETLPCARLACSFCGRPREVSRVFLAGMSGEMICDGCIALAGDILDGTAELKDSAARGAGESEE